MNNPLEELKGKYVDAYEMALKIDEMSKKVKDGNIVNGLCYALGLLYELGKESKDESRG